MGTRRFSRRQESWNRADDRIRWVEHDDPEQTERAVEAISSR